MRVKVCGLKEPENIKQIIQLPVDYIGFIFYKNSPRYLKKMDPKKLDFIDNFDVKKVGVFVNGEIDEILNKVHDYQLDFVQLHGNESPEFCSTLKELWRMSSIRSAKIIKAFSVDEHFDFKKTGAYERYCDLLLFDTKGKEHGGNGVAFDWSLLKNYKGITPFMLSGGIDEGDIDKIKQLNFPQIFGVDINSKFETEPGVKDVEKVARFLKELD